MSRHKSSRRGASMVFAMLVIMTVTIMGMGMMGAMVRALQLSRGQRDASIAFNCAESGAERALNWLRSQPSPPTGIDPIDPFGGTITLGSGTYRVSIDPDDTNYTPAMPYQRYAITSVGRSQSRQETVLLNVQLANFGRYAYFTDYEQSPFATGPIYFAQGIDVIDGPAHSNNSGNTLFHIMYGGSNDPIFRSQFTSVGSTINYNPSAPDTDEEFERIWLDGNLGYKLSVNRVELPETTTLQKEAAWGGSSSFPTTDGVYLRNNTSSVSAGIYIRGSSTVLFSVTGEGHQRIAINQGGTTWTITVNRQNNTTVVQRGSNTPVTYNGTTNGVIYSTGNITSLRGELADNKVESGRITGRNAWTIATDVASATTVTITDDFRYRTRPDDSLAWNHSTNLRAAAAGIVTRNVQVDSAAPQDLDIHAVIMAGGRNTSDGSFYVENYNTRNPVGDLHLFGGVIQKKRGPVGTGGISGGSVYVSRGYRKDYHYDRRMAISPPPYFPTTGKYERLSWQRISAGPVTH